MTTTSKKSTRATPARRSRSKTPSHLGCKVISATMAKERERLGEAYNAWHESAGFPAVERVDVRQSSDSEYHCLSLIIWYWRDAQ